MIAMDTRHKKRIEIVQQLYSSFFNKKTAYSSRTSLILKNSIAIDKIIQQVATKYATDKISKVDLAILRLAVFELLYEKKTPPKVIINEAIELAKELAAEKSPGFINAVLGKIYDLRIKEKQKN